MQHLNEEQLVLQHYGDADSGAAEHLASCAQCSNEYDVICRVLTLVDAVPVPERGADYGETVWNSVRWKMGRRQPRKRATALLAVAAVAAIAFISGLLWTNGIRHGEPATQVAGRRSVHATSTAEAARSTPAPLGGDANPRILLLVVGDHLDSSERLLVELSNADPKGTVDIASDRLRSEELVAANRIYRQTAARTGDSRIASILDELEPILLEISHAPDRLRGTELVDLQKRIEAKGLLFKVRVIGSEVDRSETAQRHAPTNSL
jgi:hypothetical protein